MRGILHINQQRQFRLRKRWLRRYLPTYLSTQATHTLTSPHPSSSSSYRGGQKNNTLLYSTDDPLRVTQ